MYRFFTIFLVAILFSSSLSSSVFAQEPPVDPEMYKGIDSQQLNEYASEDDFDVKDGYTIPTFKNLAKLYWALAMFDLGNNEAIDTYLLITECDLYQKYFSSDFEFESLRDATREAIVKNMATFPVKFEVMIPVGLDRYDTGTEKFKIDPRSQFIGAKRLEVNVNDIGAYVCGQYRSETPGYPRNIILSLSRPFTLTEVPVVPELAQLYIEESQELSKSQMYRFDISKFGRVAYLRLKVTMNQFRGMSQQTGQAPMADIFGTIDGFEFYADRKKKLLLYTQENQKIKNYRRRRVLKAVEPETSAAPATPPAAEEGVVQPQP